jgi:hypothetical protein
MAGFRKRYSEDGETPRRKKQNELDLPDVDVPFRDAHPDTDEVPLSDLDTFLIPSRDDKGQSEPIHLTVPPIMRRHIDVIIHSHRFPYLRPSDFIRHAIYRHIRYCISIRASLSKHMLVALEAIMEDARDSEMRARVVGALRKIEERVNYHLENGDAGEAMRLISVMRTRTQGVADGHFSREVQKTLEDKFFKPLLSAQQVDEEVQ